MQMRGVVSWLCNFGNCHFIHTRQCLGEGAVRGCRIPAHQLTGKPRCNQRGASCPKAARGSN